MFIIGLMNHLANSRTNFTNLFHEQDHQVKADWNFFVTAHGKGENDGVDGARPYNKRKLLQVVRNLGLLQRKSSLTLQLLS